MLDGIDLTIKKGIRSHHRRLGVGKASPQGIFGIHSRRIGHHSVEGRLAHIKGAAREAQCENSACCFRAARC